MASTVLLRKNLASEKQTVDLAWTGPVQFAVPTRSTLATAKEMVSGGTRQITVVGYRITEGAKSIFELLAERRSSNVLVRIILDEAVEQMATLRVMWPAECAPPEVYENRTSGLHAKVLVVDSCDALVTSANLTHYGLESNIEFGVRIRGDAIPLKIEALLDELVKAGHFRRVDF